MQSGRSWSLLDTQDHPWSLVCTFRPTAAPTGRTLARPLALENSAFTLKTSQTLLLGVSIGYEQQLFKFLGDKNRGFILLNLVKQNKFVP